VDSIPRWQLVIAYYGQPCYNFFFFFFFFFLKKKKKNTIRKEKKWNIKDREGESFPLHMGKEGA